MYEICDEGEIFDYISSTGHLDHKIGRYYFKQLIEGLIYLNSRGISHWDLKPENLLLDENF